MPETFLQIHEKLNQIIWGTPMLTLLLGTGLVLTVWTKGFQFTHFGYGMKRIFGNHKNNVLQESSSLSPFQTLCTALSGTIGTGNISGIAYAITVGGPGAVFWMWIAAVLGMITGFAEKVLGMYYRNRNEKGEWCGGAMYYLKYGLGSKHGCKYFGAILASLFALFTIFASLGMGNLSQVASIRESILSLTTFTGNFTQDSFIISVCIAVLTAFVTLGGLKRIAKVNERLVPFMACFYILGTLVIICMHADRIIPAVYSIFRHAFSLEAAAGGVGGTMMRHAITCGFKRGVFSNEAGLGSSVIVHVASSEKEPVVQGFWGIFEVFFDTVILCTMTALLILTSGIVDLNSGTILPLPSESASIGFMAQANTETGFSLATRAFKQSFGHAGGIFMTAALLLFALATILGWNYYGTKAWEYLFGPRSVFLYKYVYIAVILLGCTMHVDLIISLSDTFNGLMAIPNLIGVLSLTGTFLKILWNYKQRYFTQSSCVKPMRNFFTDPDNH